LAVLLSDRHDESTNQAENYNFQEGKYNSNQLNDINSKKIDEEKEYIAELNERIFKLHKAIKEK